MLKIKNLTVAYKAQIAVDNVSVNFNAGQICGLIGPNGAGKSTLLKTCCGLISNFSGDIYFEDRSLRANRFWVKQNVAYVPENAQLLPYLTGREFLKLIAGLYHLNDFNERYVFFSAMLHIEDKLDALVTTYSHGMMQKLSLAADLLPEPPFILIDEALNGLDSASLRQVKDYLTGQAKKGCHIIVSSHHIELIADWCDGVWVIDRGKIVGELSQDEDPAKLLKQYLYLLEINKPKNN